MTGIPRSGYFRSPPLYCSSCFVEPHLKRPEERIERTAWDQAGVRWPPFPEPIPVTD
jgi:hypothetical protein